MGTKRLRNLPKGRANLIHSFDKHHLFVEEIPIHALIPDGPWAFREQWAELRKGRYEGSRSLCHPPSGIYWKGGNDRGRSATRSSERLNSPSVISRVFNRSSHRVQQGCPALYSLSCRWHVRISWGAEGPKVFMIPQRGRQFKWLENIALGKREQAESWDTREERMGGRGAKKGPRQGPAERFWPGPEAAWMS